MKLYGLIKYSHYPWVLRCKRYYCIGSVKIFFLFTTDSFSWCVLVCAAAYISQLEKLHNKQNLNKLSAANVPIYTCKLLLKKCPAVSTFCSPVCSLLGPRQRTELHRECEMSQMFCSNTKKTTTVMSGDTKEQFSLNKTGQFAPQLEHQSDRCFWLKWIIWPTVQPRDSLWFQIEDGIRCCERMPPQLMR